MSSCHFFYRWNQFKVFPLACTLRTRNLPDFLRRRTRVDGTADNADISQSQAVSDDRLLSHTTLAVSNAESKQLALRAEYCIVGIPHNTVI